MKKIVKALIAILLIGGVGVGSFFLGVNSTEMASDFTLTGTAQEQEEMKRIIQNVQALRNTIKQDFLFDYEDGALETGLYRGLFQGLNDPYSVYYTAEEYKRLLEDTSGSFAGVGVVVSAGEDNLITVVSPIEGTPAAKAGLKAGDKILAIDGESFPGDQLDMATTKIRGEVGTEVTLSIRRDAEGAQQTFTVKVMREQITVKSVNARVLEGDIGYMQITSFDQETANEFETKLAELKGAGVKRLILDLRNNPGGLLDTCEAIADRLLGRGKIVTTVDKHGKDVVAESDAEQETMPIVVLVNEGSASASEILLGALRDNKRAKSVGVKTFGKGIVQRIYPMTLLKGAGAFKMTMAEYLTPNGEKIHGVGITPDIVLPLNAEAKTIGPDNIAQDNQLQRALEEIKK